MDAKLMQARCWNLEVIKNKTADNPVSPMWIPVGAEPEGSDDISSKHGREQETSGYSAAVTQSGYQSGSLLFYTYL